MTTISRQQISELRGATVYDANREKIGSVEEVFLDEQTGEPEWVGLGTGFFGTKRVLVPLAGATPAEDGLYVPYPKDQVKDTPDIDADELSTDTEQALYSHYGLDYSFAPSETGLPAGSAEGTGAEERSGTVTRSEEELAVGKQDVTAGRARLRKWVETEPVEADVELRHETARVTREPIDEPVSGAEIGEDAVDVELRQERPVVEKKAVAKERVGLEKDVETERQTVSDELRKERVEVEGDEAR